MIPFKSHLRRLSGTPAPPASQHLLRASFQQRNSSGIVRFHVKVAGPQSPPLAPPLDPFPVVKRLIAGVLEPSPAPSTARTPPPTPPSTIAVSASIASTTPASPVPAASPTVATSSSTIVATSSGRATAVPTPGMGWIRNEGWGMGLICSWIQIWRRHYQEGATRHDLDAVGI